jgi:hypothetical protein
MEGVVVAALFEDIIARIYEEQDTLEVADRAVESPDTDAAAERASIE